MHLNLAHWRPVAGVAALLALSAYIDLATGYEVSVFLLYMLPVALATRCLGLAAGLLTTVGATMLWVGADILSGHQYSEPWFLYINAGDRMVCFLLAVALIRHASARRDALRKQIMALTGDMAVCNACHRVGDGEGYWRPFETHLIEVAHATVHHKVCPDCARRQYARAAYRSSSENVG
jgi:hypothetical protein